MILRTIKTDQGKLIYSLLDICRVGNILGTCTSAPAADPYVWQGRTQWVVYMGHDTP
jgi:hypothetical protein